MLGIGPGLIARATLFLPRAAALLVFLFLALLGADAPIAVSGFFRVLTASRAALRTIVLGIALAIVLAWRARAGRIRSRAPVRRRFGHRLASELIRSGMGDLHRRDDIFRQRLVRCPMPNGALSTCRR